MRALAFAWLLFLAAPACSSFVCNATTCSSGCCEGGSCYEGMNLSGGVSCDTIPIGGGGGSNSSIGGGFGGGGTGGSGGSGGGGASCGNYDDPCNSSLPCCVSSEQNTLTNTCNDTRERCDLCGTYLYDCSDDMTICCPGLDCLLKPGFSTVYECQ